jgi:hypothetical protein
MIEQPKQIDIDPSASAPSTTKYQIVTRTKQRTPLRYAAFAIKIAWSGTIYFSSDEIGGWIPPPKSF